MRGLCNGLGPALYGLIFYLFHVDLNDKNNKISHSDVHANVTMHVEEPSSVIRVSFVIYLAFDTTFIIKLIVRLFQTIAGSARTAVCVWIIFSCVRFVSSLLHPRRPTW